MSQEQPAATVHGLRLAIGATQAELAKLLGVHETTISRWERGLVSPDPYVIRSLRYLVTAAGGLEAIHEQIAAAKADKLHHARQLFRLVARLGVAAEADAPLLLRTRRSSAGGSRKKSLRRRTPPRTPRSHGSTRPPVLAYGASGAPLATHWLTWLACYTSPRRRIGGGNVAAGPARTAYVRVGSSLPDWQGWPPLTAAPSHVSMRPS